MDLGKGAVGVFVEVEMVVGAGDGGLGVGNEGVDPTERLQTVRFMVSDDDRRVRCDLDTGGIKTCQAVGD